MKAVRSKCCKIFLKLTSISKNTSKSWDWRRQPSMTISKSLLIRSVCERLWDGYSLYWLAPKYIQLLLTYFWKTQTMAIVTAAQAQ